MGSAQTTDIRQSESSDRDYPARQASAIICGTMLDFYRAYVRWHTDSSAKRLCNAVTDAVKRVSSGIKSLNFFSTSLKRPFMNSIIYIVGLVVVVIAVLSFFGLR